MDESEADELSVPQNGDAPDAVAARLGHPSAVHGARASESANRRVVAAELHTAAAEARARGAVRRADAADKRAELAGHRADLRAEEAEGRLAGALTFFAEAEHKIKTGLTVLGGWAQILDDGWDDLTDVNRRHGISVMRERSDAMSTEADRLLDGVRAEVVIGNDLQQVHVASILTGIASAFAGLSPEGAVVAVVEGDPVAYVDGDALDQVLLHLVENAIKYSPDGRQIILRASASDTQTIIEVTDHGVGLPDDVDIFAPFVRGGDAEHAAEGSGLGLYVVARLVRAMGGTVDAQRNNEGGSTFTVTLPGLRTMPET